MKRFMVVLAVLAISGTAFGQGIDVAVGIDVPISLMTQDDELTDGTLTATDRFAFTLIGASAFVDATYVELGVGYIVNIGDVDYTYIEDGSEIGTDTVDLKVSYIQVGLAGKYPIAINDTTVFSPRLGLDYLLNLTASSEDEGITKEDFTEEAQAELNELFLQIGGDIDVGVAESVFIRIGA
ncbi:MAG: hypothetical protein ACLFP4_13620, partial [Spirochaetales bacterium]